MKKRPHVGLELLHRVIQFAPEGNLIISRAGNRRFMAAELSREKPLARQVGERFTWFLSRIKSLPLYWITF